MISSTNQFSDHQSENESTDSVRQIQLALKIKNEYKILRIGRSEDFYYQEFEYLVICMKAGTDCHYDFILNEFLRPSAKVADQTDNKENQNNHWQAIRTIAFKPLRKPQTFSFVYLISKCVPSPAKFRGAVDHKDQ